MNNISSNGTPAVPGELITNKALYTLTGASASVWITCLVVHSIFYKSISSPDIYKLIALFASLLISANFLLKKRDRKYEDWLLSIFNGFLIFIYATGFNTISTNIFSDNIDTTVSKTSQKQTTTSLELSQHQQVAGLFNFSEINWFPDKKLIKENADLREDIDSLEKVVIDYKFESENKAINKADPSLLEQNILLKKTILDLQNNQSKTGTTSSPSPANNDEYVRKLEKEIDELKRTKDFGRPPSNSTDCTRQIDSLKQSFTLVFTQQKLDNSKALNEIEKWKKKYLECLENKQSF